MELKENLNRISAMSMNNREARKNALKQSAEKSLEAIQNQLGDLKKTGTNALVIGGTIVAAYAITELLLPSAKASAKPSMQEANIETKPLSSNAKLTEDNETESVLWATMKGVATSVLLAMAKDKLMVLIEHLKEKNAKPSTE